jgi:leader peptidase (prepilin peptidase)/N-methyltransferase
MNILADLGMPVPGEWVYAFVLFLFGCCVGSFLNVVIFRLPHNISLLVPGSRCPGCGRKIGLFENIPVLSWIIQGGKCRGCKLLIHWRYPAVELLTGILWGVVGYLFWQMPAWGFDMPFEPATMKMLSRMHLHSDTIIRMIHYMAMLWFVSYLVAITIIDIDLTIIPDELNYSGFLVALGFSALLPQLHFPLIEAGVFDGLWYPAVSPHWNGLMASGFGALIGAGSIFLLNFVGTLAFQSTIKRVQETEDDEVDTAMGFGDVKLMLFLGAFIGWQSVLAAFFISCILGSFVGVAQKIRTGESAPREESGFILFHWCRSFSRRWQTGCSMIPYGPFLCIGAFIMMLFRQPILAFFAERFAVFGADPAL